MYILTVVLLYHHTSCTVCSKAFVLRYLLVTKKYMFHKKREQDLLFFLFAFLFPLALDVNARPAKCLLRSFNFCEATLQVSLVLDLARRFDDERHHL